MKTWMRCTLYPGQFPTELAVVLRSHAGRVLSLFASKTSLRYDQEPSRDAPMEGWVQVEIVKNEKNLYLVRLPQTTLENGQYLTVAAGQLESTPHAPVEPTTA